MNNIFKLITDTLSPLGHSVREQGSYAPGTTLPETFITYFIVDDSDISHADNVPTGKSYRVQIVLYSKKPQFVQEANSTIKGVMIPAGFMRIGGRSLPYNKETGHYAWLTEYRYYESEVN